MVGGIFTLLTFNFRISSTITLHFIPSHLIKMYSMPMWHTRLTKSIGIGKLTHFCHFSCSSSTTTKGSIAAPQPPNVFQAWAIWYSRYIVHYDRVLVQYSDCIQNRTIAVGIQSWHNYCRNTVRNFLCSRNTVALVSVYRPRTWKSHCFCVLRILVTSTRLLQLEYSRF
jgi:hypothetical protein